MDAMMGGLGAFNPMMTMPMMGGGMPALGGLGGSPLGGGLGGSPFGGGLGDGFMASPELAMGGGLTGFEGLDCTNPLMTGLTGFEGLDVGDPNQPGGGTAGLPNFGAMMGGMPGMDMGLGSLGGMDMGMGGMDMMGGLGGGSLANQAAGLQSAMMDGNLANAALMGAEAVGQKNGAMQGQILGDAATYGLR